MPTRKRLLSWLPVAIVIAIVWRAVAYHLPGPRIVVSRETTFLTEPLHDDGLPDYAGYLLAKEREGVSPENNGAIPFLQAMWPAGLDTEDIEPVCKELGMEIPHRPGMKDPSRDKELIAKLAEWLVSIDPERAERVRQQEELEEVELDVAGWDESEQEEYDPKDEAYELTLWGLDHPWRREQIPLLAEWVDRHAAQYDLLLEAAWRENFYCPSRDLLGTPQVDMGMSFAVCQHIRTAVSDHLALRAHLALGEGDMAGAWRDCKAMFRLADHVPRELMLGELISINTERSAHATAQLILSDPRLDRATAREMLEFFGQLPPRGGLTEIVDTWERMAALSYFIGMSQQGSELRRLEDDAESKWSERNFQRSLDWNWLLYELNRVYDELVQQMEQESGKAGTEENPFGGQWSDDPERLGPAGIVKVYLSRQARTREIGRRMLPALLPACQAGMQAQARGQGERQLLTVAAALALYRLERGEYPGDLTSLVPQFLPALPGDPFKGSPPVYRRTDEGFLLYSIGANGEDDGGSHDQHGILEGVKVTLYDLEETLENENELRQLLGRSEVTAEEFAELIKPADAEAGEENEPAGVKKLSEEIPGGADDIAIRLPLPKLKLPLPGFPPPRE